MLVGMRMLPDGSQAPGVPSAWVKESGMNAKTIVEQRTLGRQLHGVHGARGQFFKLIEGAELQVWAQRAAGAALVAFGLAVLVSSLVCGT